MLAAGRETPWNNPVYDTRGQKEYYESDDEDEYSTNPFVRIAAQLAGGGAAAIGGQLSYLGSLINGAHDYEDEPSIDQVLRQAGVGNFLLNNGEYLQNVGEDWNAHYKNHAWDGMSLGDRLTNPGYWYDSGGMMADVANGLGSSIPFMAETAVLPEVSLPARGVGLLASVLGKVGAKRVASAIDSKVLKGVADEAGNPVTKPSWLMGVANDVGNYSLKMAPMEAASNAGGIYSDLKKQGLSDSEILGKMNDMIKEELPLDMVTSGVFGATLGGKTFSRLGQGGFKRALAANALNVPMEMASEGIQEMAQQRVQNKYSGKPYGTWFNPTEDELEAGRLAAIGALPTAMWGVRGGVRNSRAMAREAANEAEREKKIQQMQNDADSIRAVAKDMSVPTADGRDVTEMDPQEAIDWFNQQTQQYNIEAPSIDMPQVNTQQAQANSGGGMPTYNDKAYTVTGEVSNPNLVGGTEQKLNALAHAYKDKFGENLQVTSMRREGNPNDSWHNSGQAFDVAGGGLESNKNGEREFIIQKGKELGLVPLDEYAHPSKHATGGHIHFSDHEGGEAKQSTQGSANNASEATGGTLTKSSGNQQYDAWIEQAAAKHGVPANLISSLLNVESGYNPNAKSPAGAVGIAQFMPSTAEAFGIDPYDPQQAIDGAARYLKQEYDYFGNWSQALEAYNGGRGNVGSGETKAYAAKVLGEAGDISNAPKQTSNTGNQQSISLPNFANMLSNKLIDFADTNDTQVKKIFGDLGQAQKDEAMSRLFAPNIFTDENGKPIFRNTAEIRAAMASNEAFQQFVRRYVEDNLAQYVPKEIMDAGSMTLDQAKDLLALRAPKAQAHGSKAKGNVQVNVQAAPQATQRTAQGTPAPQVADTLSPADIPSFVSFVNNVSHTPQDISFVQSLLDSSGKFHNTPENQSKVQQHFKGSPIVTQFLQMQQADAQNGHQDNAQVQPASQVNTQVANTFRVEDIPAFVENVAQTANTLSDVNFLTGVLDKGGHFIDTPENRLAVVAHFGSPAISKFSQAGQQKTQPAAQPEGLDTAGEIHAPETAQAQEVPVQQESTLPKAPEQQSQPIEPVAPQNAQKAAQATPKQPQVQTNAQEQKIPQEGEQAVKPYEEPQEPKATPVQQPIQQPIQVPQENVAQQEQAIANKAQQVANVQGEASNAAIGQQGTVKPQEAAPAIEQEASHETSTDTTPGAGTENQNRSTEPQAGDEAESQQAPAQGEVSPLFETSEYTLKTGKNKGKRAYTAKIARKLKKGETLASLKKKAKAHNGRWNQRLGGFNFDSAADRDAFVNESDGGRGQSDQNSEEAEDKVVRTNGERFRPFKTIKELRKKAMAYYTEHLQGTSIDNAILGKVDIDANDTVLFTGEGKHEVKSTSAKQEKLFLVPYLPKLIKYATDIHGSASQKEKHKDDYFYYLNTTAIVQGKELPVTISLIKHNDGSIHFYNLTLPSLEKAHKNKEDAPVSSRPESSANEALGTPTVGASSSTSSLPQEAGKGEKENVVQDKPINGHKGKATTVYTDDGKAVKVQYMLVPQSKVVTSDKYEGSAVVKNDAYPQDLQPRDRNRVAMHEQTDQIAQNMNPDLLGDSKNLNQGVPVIRKDGVVLNGNGRAMGIIHSRELHNDSAKAYNKWLAEHATEFGFTKAQVDALMKAKNKPMLVRVVDDANANMDSIIHSRAGGSSMGAAEQAMADADHIKPQDFADYDKESGGNLTTASNRTFVGQILHRIVSASEMNAYLDKYGNVNADGIARVKRALFAKAYKDADLIAKMAESTDDAVRNISKALENVAAQVAHINARIEAGTLSDSKLAETIAKAAERYNAIKTGKAEPTVEAYAEQNETALFHGDAPAVVSMVKAFDEFRRSGKKATSFLRDLTELVAGGDNPNELTLGLTGEHEHANLSDLINMAKEETTNGREQNLFDGSMGTGSDRENGSKPVTGRQEKVSEAGGERAQAGKSENLRLDGRGGESDAAVKPDEQPEKQSVFGSKEDAMSDLEAAFGLKRVDKTPQGDFKKAIDTNNKLFEEAKVSEKEQLEKEIADLSKQLQDELKKVNANPMFNPKIYTLGAQIGVKLVRLGFKKFEPWAAHLLKVVGDDIKPWVQSIWKGINNAPTDREFNAKGYAAAVRYCGTLHENGVTDFNAIAKEFTNTYGKEAYQNIEGYLRAADAAINAYMHPTNMEELTKGETKNADDSTGKLAERAGEGDDQNRVGQTDAGRGPRTGNEQEGVQQAGAKSGPRGGAGVRDRGTSAGGETGHRGVQKEESENRTGSAGGPELSGGVRAGYDGSARIDDGRKAADITSAQDRQVHAAAEKVKAAKPAKQNSGKFKAGDLDQIKNDLPCLQDAQAEDVKFGEDRLFGEKGGEGVLFTNGTGTGKTFTGLGLVKRMINSGRKNILIISPTEEINKSWVNTAKKFFGVDIHVLESTTDAGREGQVCVTTYANFQQNAALVKDRNWDAVIADESHNILNNASGTETGILKMLRAVTAHARGLGRRLELKYRTKKMEALVDKIRQAQMQRKVLVKAKNKDALNSLDEHIRDLEADYYTELNKLRKAHADVLEKWEKMPQQEKPRVVFLSATPFAYDKDVDYGEGYLWNYESDKGKFAGYNQGNGRDKFMMQHFGYRMRYNKLTRPDGKVDNRAMEVQFHDDMAKAGVIRGRQLEVDKDYDRGFILVGQGIGKTIDEGFEILRNDKHYSNLYEALRKKFDRRAQRYLLESIKAGEAVKLARQYVKMGRKVVIFHQSMVEHDNVRPFDIKGAHLTQEEYNKALPEYRRFAAEHPELVNINLGTQPSPMETFAKAFGDDALYIDGSAEHKKSRKTAVEQFNDDNSGKNIIIVQQDAGNAGISLHDTTGKHQRVLINIAMPERPSYAMQIEGRIYRVGNQSNAVFRYLATGTNMEKQLFASTIGGRAETVENLALGNKARGLRDSFTTLYTEILSDDWKRRLPGAKDEGTGGKEMDRTVGGDLSDWDRAKAFYYARGKKTSSNKSAEGMDYFATPEPIGMKMVQWLGQKIGDRFLEPSAGHGAISRWSSDNAINTVVEPSGKLAPEAQMVTPNAKLFDGDFMEFDIHNKFEGIAMNPPFGHGGKTAIEHVAKAYKHLADGGRMIAIIPDGPSCEAHFNKWFYGENKQGEPIKGAKPPMDAVLVASVRMPGVMFERAGTTVHTKILVIDKYADKGDREKAEANARGEADFSNVKDINELFDLMENYSMPPRIGADRVQNFTTEKNNRASKAFEAHTDSERIAKSLPIIKAARFNGGYYDNRRECFVFDTADARKKFMDEANRYVDEHKDQFAVQDTSETREAGSTQIKQDAAQTETQAEPQDKNVQANANEHIQTSTFTRTDNGEEIPAAKIAYNVDRDAYKAIRDIAKANHGYWSRVAKQFLFHTTEGRDAFAKAAAAYLQEHHAKKYSIVYHGTQHVFDQFDAGYVGTGEGLASHGWGMYFAKDKDVSQNYRERLIHGATVGNDNVIFIGDKAYTYYGQSDIVDNATGEQVKSRPLRALIDLAFRKGKDLGKVRAFLERVRAKASPNGMDIKMANGGLDVLNNQEIAFDKEREAGMLAEAKIPDENVMLDEQASVADQPPKVREALAKLGISPDSKLEGGIIYRRLTRKYGSAKEASMALNEVGIKGIKYDGKADGECYVVFDDKAISLLRKLSIGKAQREITRSAAELKHEIMLAFPHARNVRDDGDHIAFTMPNGLHVEVSLHDDMELTGREAARARADHGYAPDVAIKVNGSEYVINGQAIIDLSKRGEVGTAYHEAMHVAMQMVLNPTERRALFRKYGTEEKIADAYRDYMEKHAVGKYHAFGKLMGKIRDFFERLASHLPVIGEAIEANLYARQVFEGLASGKKWGYSEQERPSRGFSLFSRAEAAGRQIDNRAARGDNEAREKTIFVDNWLQENIPENGRQKIANDVKAGIDALEQELNPDNVEDVFDKLNCVRRLRATFNDDGRMQSYKGGLDYAQKMAAYLYGYARRCFENDERVQRQLALRSAAVRRPGAVQGANAQGVARRANERVRGNGGEALQGHATAKNGNVSVLQKLYDELLDEAHSNVHHSISRSDNQDGFSSAENERYMQTVDRYQNAKTDAEREQALDELRTMVHDAAEAAGFHNAVPEQTVAYVTRTGAAPKQTIKVYKVFTVAPDGSPTALFIGGTEKLPQGVWLDAQPAYHFKAANGKCYVPSTQNPYTKGGKTGKSVVIPSEEVRQELIERGFLPEGSKAKSITALAYRPGWHAGTLPFFPQGGKKDASKPYGMVHRSNQVVFECELAADTDYTHEARSQAKAFTKSGKPNPKNADLQYMPENGYYYYATNPLTQAHPELGAWAISGSLKINRALSQEECDRILKQNKMEAQAWEQGEMSLADLGYTGEQNDAARKTLAPITYDDTGNVIPLSDRFNPQKADIRYSISPVETEERGKSFVKRAADKLAKGWHLKGDKIMIEEDDKPSSGIGFFDHIWSPSRIASKVPRFRVLYQMGVRAQQKVVDLRNDYDRKMKGVYKLVSNKEDKADLFDLLLRGDAESKEWSSQELHDMGYNDNVAEAYKRVRRLMNKAYHMVNEARRGGVPKSATLTQAELDDLRNNKFVKMQAVTDKGYQNGQHVYTVSYIAYRCYPRGYKHCTADMIQRFEQDGGIQIMNTRLSKDINGKVVRDADGNPLQDVEVLEGPADMSKLKGYIPHFFHDYFIRVVDKNGDYRLIGSGRNQREAVMQAEEWKKHNELADGETIHIVPKTFDFNSLGMSDTDYAPVMGDMDYYSLQRNLSQHNDMSLDEAKDMLSGNVRLKGRHRFFGNALHRTGAEGYETDLGWVLNHYFHSASRYVAMETEFKPKAISYFERMYGRFDDDHEGNAEARYAKDYINDLNGNPSTLEQSITDLLMHRIPYLSKLFRNVVVPTYGERAALTFGNGISRKISYLTLGLNMSSALLNFTQLVNAAAYLGSVRSLATMVAKGRHHKYSIAELRVLREAGVFADIGLDSGSGYDQMRRYSPTVSRSRLGSIFNTANTTMDWLGNKSMFFFQEADAICRRGTVLAAYEKARKEGKSHREAIAYAQEINRKANFDYGVADAPNIFRRGSIISQLTLQFKKFGIKELEVMGDFLGKSTSAKQKAMFWGMYFLLAGAMGIPALDWLDDFLGERSGFYSKDELQKIILKVTGGNKLLAVVAMYGAPALANINMSNRAGLSDVIPTSIGDFAGAALSKTGRLIQDLSGGNYASALRDVSPGLYNLYAAGSGESYGKRDRLNDRYVTAWDRILRAVGFRSVDESAPVDMQRIISHEKTQASKEKQKAQDAYIRNPSGENAAKLKALGVNPKDVKKEQSKKGMTREQRMEQTVPKKDRANYQRYIDFAKE